MCTMLAAEGTPPQLTALKRQHAEHLLEVVRFAEKQEAERQKRLRHATSKCAMAYLQKRYACVSYIGAHKVFSLSVRVTVI